MSKKNETERPLEELASDHVNARTIKDESLRGLGVSVAEFGDLSGIVYNEQTGHLVAGHQRLKALRTAGAKTWHREGDAAWVEHPKTHERFPVRIVQWDETKQRMANIAANNPEIAGTFTDELEDQLRSLEEEAKFEELRMSNLLATLDGGDEPGQRERRTLEDFDTTPAPRKSWILIATTEGHRCRARGGAARTIREDGHADRDEQCCKSITGTSRPR